MYQLTMKTQEEVALLTAIASLGISTVAGRSPSPVAKLIVATSPDSAHKSLASQIHSLMQKVNSENDPHAASSN